MEKDKINTFLKEFSYDKNIENLVLLSNDVLEKNYKEGILFYKNNEYEKASDIFHDLVIARPFTKKYWFALASSMQAKKEFEKAAKDWTIVAFLDDKDPLPHFYAAECLYSFSDKEQTKKALFEAEKRCRNDILLKNKILKLKKICSSSKEKIRC